MSGEETARHKNINNFTDFHSSFPSKKNKQTHLDGMAYENFNWLQLGIPVSFVENLLS